MVGFEAIWLGYYVVLDVNAGSGNHGQVLSMEDQALDRAVVGPCFVVEQADGSVSARDGRADSSQDSLREGWITGRVVVCVVESLARDADSAMAQYGRLVDAIQQRSDTGTASRNKAYPATSKSLVARNFSAQAISQSTSRSSSDLNLPNQVDVCICMLFRTGKSIHAGGHGDTQSSLHFAPRFPEIHLLSERDCLKAVLLRGMMVWEVKQCPPICLCATFSTSCVERTLCDGDVGVGRSV
ncbi:hypothetical protein P692DRAFT_20849177 [Suillus brevipes Sb2]|nr:hypothetical protein P692DRAFT_20849177 [Suillus brevipes Sb2]